MAKKTTAKRTTATKPAAAKPTAKKAAAAKRTAAKPMATTPVPTTATAPKAARGRRNTAAERISRTLGRAAKGIDKVKAVVKRAGAGRGKKPKRDPEVEATRAKNRATWKSQAKEATSVELSKQGALVDERARVRATTGMSWSNRKPR